MLINSIKIRQAVKCGYIECINGGVADLSYPTSKLRRGRCQKYASDEIPGTCAPTLTCTDNALFRIEVFEEDDMNLKVKELLDEEKCVRVEDVDTGDIYRIAIRKLTCEETFILQGMTSEDVKKCRNVGLSNSSLYKISGNGLTTTAVQYLSEHLYKAIVDKNYETTDEKMCAIYN